MGSIFLSAWFAFCWSICITLVETSPHGCYAEKDDPYKFTATKTGYYLPILNPDDSELQFEGCESPDSFWFLARHGTRYPTTVAMGHMRKQLPKIRDHILTNHKAGRGSLCEKDLERLAEWSFNLTSKDALILTKSGEKEMLGLGRRWRNRLKHMVNHMNSSSLNDEK